MAGAYIMMFAETFGHGLVPALLFSLMFVTAIYCTAMMTLKVLINRKDKRYVVYYVLCSLFF